MATSYPMYGVSHLLHSTLQQPERLYPPSRCVTVAIVIVMILASAVLVNEKGERVRTLYVAGNATTNLI